MTPWQRLKNLWKLSAIEDVPRQQASIEIFGHAEAPRAVFIPHEKRDPVKELTNHE